MTNELLKGISDAVVALDDQKVVNATKKALDAGLDPLNIVKSGLLKGLLAVGDRWQRKELFVSHVLLAARAMKSGISLVEPKLLGKRGEPLGTVVIGTVEGDVHDIGKNLVSLMLQASGFEIHDLGVDVPPQKFIDKAKEVNADLICSSLIMSVCLDKMKEIQDLATSTGLRPKVKTMVGGAPLSTKIARQIGADAYAADAVAAAEVAKDLLGLKREVA